MRSTLVGTGWVVFPSILVIPLFLSPLTLAAEDSQQGSTDRTVQDSAATFADSLSLTSRKDPIHIRSHDLEFFYEEKRIQYRGNVVVTQGDMTLKSDRLTVLYEDPAPAAENTSAQQRLKHIVAEGRVEITSGERRATSRKAVFNQKKRTVTLRGNAVLQEGSNQVKGDIVTVFLDENRSIVKGGKGKRQAHMVLIPD
jgi:lipopolysaccharide export system protein LptA